MKKLNKKGFTLTEILIVLVVAGILLALILPNVLKAIERGNVTAHESNLNTIQVAMFMCFTEKRVWDQCNDIDQLVTDNFLEAVPAHPFSGTYTIEADPNGTAGFVACSEGEENFPADLAADNCDVVVQP
ncbi:MAG: competence type IV pilus major pilin ComGC [Candidatus Omnitrophota bacterium]